MVRRQRNLFGYALSSLRRYKVRTFVVIVAVTMTIAVFSSVSFLKDGLAKDAELGMTYAPDITVQYLWSGRQTFIPLSYSERISVIQGVERVVPRVWGYGSVGNNLITLMGIDVANMPISFQESFPLESGRFLTPTTLTAVVIGEVTAEVLGVKVGDYLTIISESVNPVQFQVIGIFGSKANIYAADLILMNIDDARVYFRVAPDKASDLCVYVKDQKKTIEVARSISLLPNLRVLTKDIISRSIQTVYGSRSGFFTVVWSVVLLAMALIAFNQFTVVGHESMFEVGLLKALGFSTSDIIQIRLVEAAVLGLFSASLGSVIGIIYDSLLGAPGLKQYMLGWAQLYPSFEVPVYISISSLFLIYVITIIPLLFATVIPSWVNATVDPDIAMRGAKA